MFFLNLDASNRRNHVSELIDSNHPVLSKIERLTTGRLHQLVDPNYTVIDIAERPSLLSVSPDFNLLSTVQLRKLNFSTDGSWSLFATPIPGPQWPEYVMKPDNASLQAIVLTVMPAQSLGNKLLPPVGILRLGRIRRILFQWQHIHIQLKIFRIDACRGGIQITGHIGIVGCLKCVEIDKRIVVQDSER